MPSREALCPCFPQALLHSLKSLRSPTSLTRMCWPTSWCCVQPARYGLSNRMPCRYRHLTSRFVAVSADPKRIRYLALPCGTALEIEDACSGLLDGKRRKVAGKHGEWLKFLASHNISPDEMGKV